ncbi:MAG: VOC family protein [Alphaproteobacteria bacterium]|nr:MAG: VOC family protein [Alphaproteobacteria bacterium]
MISYGTVGSNRLEEAKAFYDRLLGSIGMKPYVEHPSGGRLYASEDGRLFGVLGPFDGKPATVGNGSMHGFAMDSRAKVDAFHKLALELGGSDEGAPGLRGPEEMNLYFAYVRDLDGNKLCAYKIGPEV